MSDVNITQGIETTGKEQVEISDQNKNNSFSLSC